MTMVIILNLSSAFDTVDHDVLLAILEEQFSFYKGALKWFSNYLWPRFFKVCIDGKYSEAKELKFSVPLGSCKGANLFSCYWSLIGHIVPGNITINCG